MFSDAKISVVCKLLWKRLTLNIKQIEILVGIL